MPLLRPALHPSEDTRHAVGDALHRVDRVARDGHGPTGVTVNGTAVPFEREANPYRSGGARLPMAALAPLLTAGENEIVVQLG